MNSSDHFPCRGALHPGQLVKDRLGARKRITRVEGETVYWEYVTSATATPGEHSTAYEEFVGSHFVLPGSLRGAA